MKKRYQNDEDIERALFAMPLEKPPADLRASILAATIYREPVSVKPWELWLLGALAAVMVWLCVLVLRGGAGPVLTSAENGVYSALAFFAQPAVLLSIAIGGAAIWFSQLNLTMLPGYNRTVRR